MKICIINKPSLLPHDSNKNPSEKLGTIQLRFSKPMSHNDFYKKIESFAMLYIKFVGCSLKKLVVN